MSDSLNLLITGGCGFIGSNFVRLMCDLSDGEGTPLPGTIVNLDKLTYAGNPANLKAIEDRANYVFVQSDIAATEALEELLSTHSIDAVIHFAAESHVDRSIDSPEPFITTNVVGTLRLLDAANRYWRGLAGERKERFRFLHVSTDEVYGSLSADAPAFTETNPYEPNSPYAASKAGSDHLVRAYHHTYGLPTVVTNCSNNYGPFQFPEKLIPLIILNCLEGRPLPIYGDGSNVRDWLYVEDHCTGIWDVLTRGRLGECYNIGGLNEMKNIEVVDTICGILDELMPREDGAVYGDLKTFVTDRPGHDRRYAMDCTKIGAELGWKPKENFQTGIRKTVSWYLNHREWCDDISSGKYNRQRLGL